MAHRKKPTSMGHNDSSAAKELLIFIERVERLEDEKAAIIADIKEVKAEAKGRGFDLKAIDRIVKERAETRDERARRLETEAITDLYRAALGMLDGTPLGDSARERLSKQAPRENDEHGDSANHPPDQMDLKPTLTDEDIAAAKEAGRQACSLGRRVIDNPFVAGDPRRAAWDDGWCAESGSDGMDIPQAWRRSEKKRHADEPATSDDKNKG